LEGSGNSPFFDYLSHVSLAHLSPSRKDQSKRPSIYTVGLA